MKARFWVVSSKGYFLRDRLNGLLTNDRKLESELAKYSVRLKKQRKMDRQRGWSWVHSRHGGRGSVRYRWNPQLKIMECWAVARGKNRPSQLIGEFIEAVLNSQSTAIKSIHIEVG